MSALAELNVTVVGEDELKTCAELLRADALKEGGTASMLLKLKREEGGIVPIEVTCCSRVTIVRELTEFEFKIKCATFFIDDVDPFEHARSV